MFYKRYIAVIFNIYIFGFAYMNKL